MGIERTIFVKNVFFLKVVFLGPSDKKIHGLSPNSKKGVFVKRSNEQALPWPDITPTRYYPDPSDESGNFWVDPVNSLLEFDNATLTAVGRVMIINIVHRDDDDDCGGDLNDHDYDK